MTATTKATAPAASADDAFALAWTVPPDHPAFAGHFPGQPLLPGALLLAEVVEALLARPELAARLGPAPTLSQAKFLAPVPPGAALALRLHTAATGGLAFEIRCGGQLAASGQLGAGPAAPAAPADEAAPAAEAAEADEADEADEAALADEVDEAAPAAEATAPSGDAATPGSRPLQTGRSR